MNCVSCSAHRKEVIKLCSEYSIVPKIYDVDDEKYLYQSLSAMKKYGVNKTPSIVVIKGSDHSKTIQGIKDSIKKLKDILDEERNN